MSPPELPFLSSNQPTKDRQLALYSFTRAQRDSNPSGYAFNVKWWADVLTTTLSSGYAGALSPTGRDRTVLKVNDDLLERLSTSSGARMRGMGGVIDTLIDSNTLIQFQKYMDATSPIEAPSLVSRVTGAAVSAGWSVLSRVLPVSEASEEQLWKSTNGKEYVHIPSVKAAAHRFAERQKTSPPLDYTDHLYSRVGFARAFGEDLSARDVDVLLRWLARDVGSIVVEGDVVKLGSGAITEADRGAVSVSDALEKVEDQITAAEAEAGECEDKARKQLKAGKRSAAASYLRSKRLFDELVVKRVAAGEQLRAVKMALNRAKGDVEIMKAYEESTAALSATLKDPRLNHERIAETTDALADALADQEEIDQAIRGVGRVGDDEEDLAEELEALVLEEKEEQRKRAEAEAKAKVEAEARAKVEAEEKAEARAAAVAQAELKARAEEKRLAEARKVEAGKEVDDWSARHAEAQQREVEERQRAEAERLAKEAKYVPAE